MMISPQIQAAILEMLAKQRRHPFQLDMRPGVKVYKANFKRGKRQRKLNNWK